MLLWHLHDHTASAHPIHIQAFVYRFYTVVRRSDKKNVCAESEYLYGPTTHNSVK